MPVHDETKVGDAVYTSMMVAPLEVHPCPWNTRGAAQLAPDCPAIRELAASIERHDLLQPIGVRRIEDDDLEIVWGDRRRVASIVAGLERVPARLVEWRVGDRRDPLPDDAAKELHWVENADREDLEPWEEALTVRALAGQGATYEEIAARLRKGEGWVARRLAVAELDPRWFEEWGRDGYANEATPIARWSLAHLEVCARLPHETQARLLEFLLTDTHGAWHLRQASTADLSRWLAQEWERVLSTAPWALDDATLVPGVGACTACPKRASCRHLLFAEAVRSDKTDRCLDRHCWSAKIAAHTERKIAEVEARNPDRPVVLIGDDRETKRLAADSASIAARTVVPEYAVQSCLKSRGGVPALYVTGPRAGKTVYVAPPSNHAAKGKLTELPLAEQIRERAAKLDEKRRTWRVEKLRATLEEAEGQVGDRLHRADRHDDEAPAIVAMPDEVTLLRLIVAYGYEGGYFGGQFVRETFEEVQTREQALEKLWCTMLGRLCGLFELRDKLHLNRFDSDGAWLADRLNLPWDAWGDEAAREIPEPAVLSKLRAQYAAEKAAKKKPVKTSTDDSTPATAS